MEVDLHYLSLESLYWRTHVEKTIKRLVFSFVYTHTYFCILYFALGYKQKWAWQHLLTPETFLHASTLFDLSFFFWDMIHCSEGAKSTGKILCSISACSATLVILVISAKKDCIPFENDE